MGNVSTRPRDTATVVTKAVTAVTKPQTSTPDKPRARAASKAAKPALQVRLDEIFAKLRDGQEKLQLALESAELTHSGESVEVLLHAVVEDMLPSAIAPIYRQPLTRADADKAYAAMFVPLAAIDGAIALARGHVIESTLREAWQLLDEANGQMDLANEFKLPDAVVEAQQQSVEIAPTERAEVGEALDPYVAIAQARSVAEVVADRSATDALWGVHSLIEKAAEKVDAASSRRNSGSYSSELHDQASNELAGVLGILRAINTDEDELLGAAETLVFVAKAQIDAEISESLQ